MRIACCAIACFVFVSMSNAALARGLRIMTYAELKKGADVIAIVELVETRVSKKPTHPFGPTHKYAEEIVTELKPLAVFKGPEKDLDELLLVHFQYKKPMQGVANGPNLVSFQKKRRYLVFLKKLGNDHYEPVNGQMDPIYSVKLLPE